MSDTEADAPPTEVVTAPPTEAGAPSTAAPTDPATVPPSTEVAGSKTVDPEAVLMNLLNESTLTAAGRVAVATLQRACMKVPQLSTKLDSNLRVKLYAELLLDDGEPLAPAVSSFAPFVDHVKEAQKGIVAQLVQVFANSGVEEAEVAGVVGCLAGKDGFSFAQDRTTIVTLMATLVSEATTAFPTGPERLRVLYCILRALNADYLTPTSSILYDGATAHLIRLVLQYHDPALSIHFDQHQVDIGAHLLQWVHRFFVAPGAAAREALTVIDWVLILGDPVMVPYVAVAYLVSHRQRFLAATEKDSLTAMLAAVTFALPASKTDAVNPGLADGRHIALIPVWSGKSLMQNADLVYRNTPLSTQRILEQCLYPEYYSVNKTPDALESYYAGMPCLPLERVDIATSFSKSAPDPGDTPPLQYIIVDCRSQASYDYARLPTAVFVGDIVSFDVEKLEEVLHRLEPVKGSHLSLFGTGRPIVEEQNLLKLVALQFAQKGFPYVSIAVGGFKSTVALIRSQTIQIELAEPLPAASHPSGASGLDNASQAISSVLTGLTAYLPTAPVESDSVKHKAEELSAKAREGVTAAGAWGWGMVQRFQERLAESRATAAAARPPAPGGTASGGPQAAALPSSAPNAPASAAAPSTSSSAGVPTGGGPVQAGTTSAPLQGRVAPPNSTGGAKVIFSLGEDDEDEDDDFGLITSVPARPLKGVVIAPGSESGSGETSTNNTVAAAAAASSSSVPPTAPPPAPTVSPATAASEERESSGPAPAVSQPQHPAPPAPSTPTRSHDTPGEASSAAVASSPEPKQPAPASAASPGKEGSAAGIAASIDKEFDELFGDL